MANFKGGFAFNNEAAKVEVEQAPDGTLISCVNPVTGESLGGGGGAEIFTPIFRITNHSGSTRSVTFNIYYTSADEIIMGNRNQSITNNNSALVRDALLVNGVLIVTASNPLFKFAAVANCTIESFNDPGAIYGPICYVTPIDATEEVSIELITN